MMKETGNHGNKFYFYGVFFFDEYKLLSLNEEKHTAI